MAHLLLMYQYLRAKREVNELTAKSFKFSGKKDRIKKNIEKTQKYYTDQKAQLDSQVKLLASNASIFYNGQVGINTQQLSPYAMNYGLGGNNGWAIGQILSGIENGAITGLTADQVSVMQQMQCSPGFNISSANYDSFNDEQKEFLNKAGITDKDTFNSVCTTYYKAMQNANIAYNNASMWVQQQTAGFNQTLDAFKKAREAQLEAEQDAALEPLNYEETMMELEETTTKTKLEEKKQELDNIKQELSQRVKDDAVSFGLS